MRLIGFAELSGTISAKICQAGLRRQEKGRQERREGKFTKKDCVYGLARPD